MKNILQCLIIACALISFLEANDSNRLQINLIEQHMDNRVNPCYDFYKYACGNWLSNNTKNAKYTNTITYLNYKANKDFEEHFSTIKQYERLFANKFLQNIYNYFQSCKNLDEYDPRHYLKLLKTQEQINWPTPVPHKNSYKTQDQKYNWLKTLAILRKYGLNNLFIEESVKNVEKNGSYINVEIDYAGDFQPLKLDEFQLIMSYLMVKKNSRKAKLLWNEIEKFEQSILTLHLYHDTNELIIINYKTVSDLNYYINNKKLSWLKEYVNIITEQLNGSNILQLTIQNPTYFIHLKTILNENYNSEFICRYLMIRFLWHLNKNAPENFFIYDCVEHTRILLPLATRWLYRKNHLQLTDDIPIIENIFKHLINNFRQMINANINGFDKKILHFLHKKLNALRISFDNLPQEIQPDLMDNFYKDLTLTKYDFYKNHLKILYFNIKNELSSLNFQLPMDEMEIDIKHLDDEESASPYFIILANLVVVRLISLQKPLYDRNLHDIFKYSSFGFLLAHEIMHTFDHDSLNYDWKGDWQGPIELIVANELYDKNLKCLRDLNPSGVDEKIADINGFNWAYKTYFDSMINERESNFDWSPYSAKKLFFLNFAQFFCGDPSSIWFQDSLHGADNNRVNDILKHFEDFSRIYNCPKGSPMNPSQRCHLWR